MTGNENLGAEKSEGSLNSWLCRMFVEKHVSHQRNKDVTVVLGRTRPLI